MKIAATFVGVVVLLCSHTAASMRTASLSQQLTAGAGEARNFHDAARQPELPNPTSSGYLELSNELGSAIYYMYFEADPEEGDTQPDLHTAPIIVWLQVRRH